MQYINRASIATVSQNPKEEGTGIPLSEGDTTLLLDALRKVGVLVII